MTNYKETTMIEIVKDAQAKGTEAIEMLKKLVSTKRLNKNGVETELSFVEVRKAYFEKYYPELLPKPRAVRPSMKDLVFAL